MRVSRRALRWPLAAAAVLLALVGAAALVPFLVPVDRFRPTIVRLVEENTGRKVAVEALQLHLLPTIHLHVTNLHVMNPPGFPDADTLVVRSLDIGTTLGSVLARRLDVTSVAANGVEVHLLQTPRGATNYDFSRRLGAPAAVHAARAATAQGFSVGRIEGVTARGLMITSGTYEPGSRKILPLFALDGVNVRTGPFNPGVPRWAASVDTSGDLGGVLFSNPALTRPLAIQKGSFTIHGGAAHVTFAAALDTMRLEASLSVADIAHPVVEFQVASPALDVDRLEALARAGGPAPPAAPGGPPRLLARGGVTVGRVIASPLDAGGLTVRLAVYTDRAEVDSYALTALGGTARGAAVLDYAQARQPLRVTAQARGLDIAAVLKAAGRAAPGITGRLDADAHAAMTLVPDPLGALRVTVDSYTLAAFDGVVRGTAAVDYGAPGRPARMTARGRGVGLGQLVRLLGPAAPAGIGGTLDVDAVAETGLGRDPRSALAGSGTFVLRHGIFPGLAKPLEVPAGTFQVAGGRARGTFNAVLDRISAQGTVAVADLTHPVPDFDVAAPALDLADVRTVFARAGGGAGGSRSGAAPRPEPRRLVAQGALRIGHLRARPLDVTAVAGRMRVFTDAVAVDSYTMAVYGGTVRGAMNLGYAAAGMPAQATVQVAGVDVRRALAALAPGGRRTISGTLDGNAGLAIALAPDPLAALTGSGTFVVRNGAITGLDVKNTLVTVAKIAQFVSGDLTKFRSFGGDFRIQQRRIYSNALVLDSDELHATGQGSTGFDRTLHYTGLAQITTTVLSQPQTQLGLALLRNALGGRLPLPGSVQDFTARVPFGVSGTVDDPKFSTTGVPQVTPLKSPAKPSPAPGPQQPPQIPGLPQLPFKLPPLPFPVGP
jgi:hypothetical protein